MERCECGKRTYPNQDTALTSAVRHAGRFGVPFRAYPCHLNRSRWHLTTKPQRSYTTTQEVNPT